MLNSKLPMTSQVDSNSFSPLVDQSELNTEHICGTKTTMRTCKHTTPLPKLCLIISKFVQQSRFKQRLNSIVVSQCFIWCDNEFFQLCTEMFIDHLLFNTVEYNLNFLSRGMIRPNVSGTSLPYTQMHFLSWHLYMCPDCK